MKSRASRGRSALLLLGGLSAPLAAGAFPVDFFGLDGNLDTTISFGAAVRVEDRDPALIGIANGGTSRSVNDDDGNLNYGASDRLSVALKATHDLALDHDDYGLFGRVTYFYDFEHAGSEKLGPRGEDRLGDDIRLLDLFAHGKWELGERLVSARVGNQVINWGESTFIGNSINSINPVDVAKLRTPGAEIKEALKPSPIVWGSVELLPELRLEGLWIAEFDQTEIDPRGAPFSTNDFISDDGDNVYVAFGRRNDQHQPFAPPVTPGPPDDQGNPTTVPNPTAQVWVPRGPDRPVDDEMMQYGLALRWFAEHLNNTEFGFYWLHYHSRTPLISTVRGGTTNTLNESAAPRCDSTAASGCRATYFQEFPENIDLYGVSFNTGGPYGIAFQGEYSYRPNQPVQMAAVELLLATLGLPNNQTGTGTFDADGDPATAPVPVAATVPVGTVLTGYRSVAMHQVQATATKAFGPTLWADQFVLLGEAGFNYLDLPDGVLFAGPGASLPAPGSANAAGGSFQHDGYATRTSWGYRAVGRMDFENVIDAAQLSPRLVFAHDVDGVGPNFNQDTMAVTVGVGMNYLQRWQADLAFTSFFGGRTYAGTDTAPPPPGQSADYATSANPLKDRDFVAISVSYAF